MQTISKQILFHRGQHLFKNTDRSEIVRIPSESFIDPHMVPWTELNKDTEDRSQQTNVNNVNKKLFTW